MFGNESADRFGECYVGLAVYGELGVLRDPVDGARTNGVVLTLLFDREGLALGGKDLAVKESAIFIDSFALWVLTATEVISADARYTGAAYLLKDAREEGVPENFGVPQVLWRHLAQEPEE